MMKKSLISTVLVLLYLSSLNVVLGQVIKNLSYLDHVVLTSDEPGKELLGGLSSICFNKKLDQYIMVADKPAARFYSTQISIDSQLKLNWIGNTELTPTSLKTAELEGIAYNSITDSYYLSDEQGIGTRIFEIEANGEFKRIVYPLNKPFEELSGHNSGIEGLALSDDGKELFFNFERPTTDCSTQKVVSISKYSLESGIKINYAYKLHLVEDDVLGTNGVTALAYVNDSTLLVLERAYIVNQGNVVRIFEVSLGQNVGIIAELDCSEPITPVVARLILDFKDINQIAIDNAEGLAFNGDKSILFIITDDNFSSTQSTQLVALKVHY